MRLRFSTFSNFLAVLCAVLFVIATVLALLLYSFSQTLFNAETYKHTLMENKAYEQLPALLAEGSSSFERILTKPCTDQALVCAMDGDSPELQTCLMDILGEQAYVEIGNRGRQPTAAELESSQPCLDQYENTTLQPAPQAGPPGDTLLSTSSAGVQACARQVLGDEIYEELYNGQRPPTQREIRRINACIRQERREARLNNPGIGGDLMPVLDDFSPSQWEQLIRFLLPRNDIQHLTESALDRVFAYWKGESDTASISLLALKARLTGQSGQELILFLLEAQPPCTEAQRAQIDAGNFDNGGGTAIYCAASGETLAKMIPHMQSRLNRVIAQLPDETVLIKSTSGDPLTLVRMLYQWMQLSPLLSLALLLLVTIFRVRSVNDLLRWWGIPLFIAGLLALGIGLAAGPLLDWAWVNYAFPRFPPVISPGLAELGHKVFLSVGHELGKWVMLEAGLIALLGLAAIIGSNFVRPPAQAAVPGGTTHE